jgi:MoxR-like ATPase
MSDVAENNNDSTRQLVQRFHTATTKIREQVRGTIVGQDDVVDNLLITLFVGGHCLITGMPGTAKTLLVHTLSTVHP